jgi:hypothetical protein
MYNFYNPAYLYKKGDEDVFHQFKDITIHAIDNSIELAVLMIQTGYYRCLL